MVPAESGQAHGLDVVVLFFSCQVAPAVGWPKGPLTALHEQEDPLNSSTAP